MKKHILQTILPVMLLITAVFIIGSGCNSNPPYATAPTCDDAQPISEPIFTALGNEGDMDL